KCDGHDFDSMQAALEEAKNDPRPSLIVGKTIIGYGSPNKQGKAASHGSPLGQEELRAAKEFHGLPVDKEFFVPEEDIAAWRERAKQGAAMRKEWEDRLAKLPADQQDAFRTYLLKRVKPEEL